MQKITLLSFCVDLEHSYSFVQTVDDASLCKNKHLAFVMLEVLRYSCTMVGGSVNLHITTVVTV